MTIEGIAPVVEDLRVEAIYFVGFAIPIVSLQVNFIPLGLFQHPRLYIIIIKRDEKKEIGQWERKKEKNDWMVFQR